MSLKTRVTLSPDRTKKPIAFRIVQYKVAEVPMQNRLPHQWLLTLVIVFATRRVFRDISNLQYGAERIRETERQRLRSLVEVDIPTAERLHADDFQLIIQRGHH